MALFNFDSESNITSTKIPSAKSINKFFGGTRGCAGLWIADDNMEACKWKKECTANCSIQCNEHYVNTIEHVVQASEGIMGRGVKNCRIIVLHRTRLIRLSSEKNYYCGFWVKGDGEEKDDSGKKKYVCARRYLLLFLDENNEPLHEEPIQLTAKGMFQMDFDNTLMKFREEIKNAYVKSMNRKNGRMNDLWYAMCVFCPTFESKMVGKQNLKSEACSVKSYIIPTESNWINLCVGRNIKVNEIVNLMYNDTESWKEKYNTEKSQEEIEDNCSVKSY